MGQECNADVLLVHSPAAEKDFMSNNYGSDRRLVMHNDFIIVAPQMTQLGLNQRSRPRKPSPKSPRRKPNSSSRGDDSGTNTKELGIWKSANITPEGDGILNQARACLPR